MSSWLWCARWCRRPLHTSASSSFASRRSGVATSICRGPIVAPKRPIVAPKRPIIARPCASGLGGKNSLLKQQKKRERVLRIRTTHGASAPVHELGLRHHRVALCAPRAAAFELRRFGGRLAWSLCASGSECCKGAVAPLQRIRRVGSGTMGAQELYFAVYSHMCRPRAPRRESRRATYWSRL